MHPIGAQFAWDFFVFGVCWRYTNALNQEIQQADFVVKGEVFEYLGEVFEGFANHSCVHQMAFAQFDLNFNFGLLAFECLLLLGKFLSLTKQYLADGVAALLRCIGEG